ncbi:glycerophosphodiester phosphodiesterase [Sphaerisporangium rhizosphaerae]|uniref:Glycerophosphodiester phosphodiesterase n=1 Tax=Sphaerisporangium rhizosphaerae TaxID=2269375 RepID=A0ABW2NXK9_9ACTN
MYRRSGLIIATSLAVLAATAPASPTTAASRTIPSDSRTTATVSGPAAAVLNPASAVSAATAATASVVTVAHRGASADAPENTISAFRLAREQGADMFELDVQETRDHKLVLMHDTTLTRTTDVERVFPGRAPWRVRDLTLAQIRKLDAGSWFAARYKDEPVPTLGETLRAMDGGGLGLLLEIKAPELYPGIEARVAAELRREASWLQPGRLVVQSFGWASMRGFHRIMPRVPIGLLGTPSTTQLPGLARFARQVNPPYGNLTARYVRWVHDHGMEVFAWTVDDVGTMRRLISYGVDGIITNRPGLADALSRASARRG